MKLIALALTAAMATPCANAFEYFYTDKSIKYSGKTSKERILLQFTCNNPTGKTGFSLTIEPRPFQAFSLTLQVDNKKPVKYEGIPAGRHFFGKDTLTRGMINDLKAGKYLRVVYSKQSYKIPLTGSSRAFNKSGC